MSSYSLSFDSFETLQYPCTENDGKNSWNSSSLYVVLYQHYLWKSWQWAQAPIIDFVILKGYMHSEVKSSKYFKYTMS